MVLCSVIMRSTIQMKALSQYFPVVLLVLQYLQIFGF